MDFSAKSPTIALPTIVKPDFGTFIAPYKKQIVKNALILYQIVPVYQNQSRERNKKLWQKKSHKLFPKKTRLR